MNELTLHERALIIDALLAKKNEIPQMVKHCPINVTAETKQYQDLIDKLRNSKEQ